MNLGEKGCEHVYCVNIVQDRDPWRAFLNTVINLGSHKTREIS